MPQPGQQPAPAGMPVSDEQKQELLGMIQKIKDKLAPLSAVRFASNNKTEQFRKDMLKQVFEKLQLAGVDLSNKDSVADEVIFEHLRILSGGKLKVKEDVKLQQAVEQPNRIPVKKAPIRQQQRTKARMPNGGNGKNYRKG